ncbi:MAG: hypothetical protein ACYDG6_07660 [Thermincolia bacterium]
MINNFITVHLVLALFITVLWYQPWIPKVQKGERILNLEIKVYPHGQEEPIVWSNTSDKKQINRFIGSLGWEELVGGHVATDLGRSYRQIILEATNDKGERDNYILEFENSRPLIRAAQGEVKPWQKESYSPSVTLIRTLEAYHFQALGKGHLIRELQSEPHLVFNN